jgi:hypothetical protein
MYKMILIIGTILIASACKSSKANCDAYGDNNTIKKENRI